MDFEGQYRIKTFNGRIELHTDSFRADRGSVLHSGIFNKELASSFLAAVVIVSYLIVAALFRELRLIHYAFAAILFIVIFPLARLYVFGDPELVTVIDSDTQRISLTLKRPYRTVRIEHPLGSVKDIIIDHLRIEPENPDGIAVVEKIALQHGTVIPGFGEVKEFFNVVIDCGSERYTALTTGIESEARKAASALKKYIG